MWFLQIQNVSELLIFHINFMNDDFVSFGICNLVSSLQIRLFFHMLWIQQLICNPISTCILKEFSIICSNLFHDNKNNKQVNDDTHILQNLVCFYVEKNQMTALCYRNTAEDVFGRVEGEFSFTAANTFKLDHWHTLSLIMKHHPLNWTYTQFMDLMHTSQKW